MTPVRLGGDGARPCALTLLVADLTRGNSTVRLRAVEAVGRLGAEAAPAVEAMLGALVDRSILVRVGAAEALGKIGPAAVPAVPALIAALEDSYASVRETAAEALGQIGPGAGTAISALGDLLHDSEPYVRAAAARALGRIGRAAVARLLGDLADPAPEVREAAADALGDIGPEAIAGLPALRRLRADPEVAVRLSAAATIWRIGRDRAALAPIFAAIDEPSGAGRTKAALLIGRFGLQDLASRPEPEIVARDEPPRPRPRGPSDDPPPQAAPSARRRDPEARIPAATTPRPRPLRPDFDDDRDPAIPIAEAAPPTPRPRPVAVVRVPAPEPRPPGPPPAGLRERPVILLASLLSLVGVMLIGVRWLTPGAETAPRATVQGTARRPALSAPPETDGLASRPESPASGAEAPAPERDRDPSPVPPPVAAKPTFPADSVLTSIGLRLVPVRPGSFTMGSAESGDPNDLPAHPVEITRPFLLGAFEVTQGEWAALFPERPHVSWFPARASASNRRGALDEEAIRHPVEQVTWLDAVEFCSRLSTREHLAPFYRVEAQNVTIPDPSGAGYRLPTEAEWEFAARAGTPGMWSFGDRASDLAAHAWFGKNSGETTHPVGLMAANGLGLFDMYGNVSEWCWDWDAAYPAAEVKDPNGPASGKYRILRGGAWDSYGRDVGSPRRAALLPTGRLKSAGLRVARNLPDPATSPPKAVE